MKSIKESIHGAMDLGTVLMIGIAFAGLMVVTYIIWELQEDLVTPTSSTATNASIRNITQGFDDAVNLLLVAITIIILAIAISALLMLRGK